MRQKAMGPYGLALMDYFNGDHSATLIMHRDDGCKFKLSAEIFFTEFPEFTKIEKLALELCFGDVLDIGAGAGRHSLELQNRGLNVHAIDIAAEADSLDVRCTDDPVNLAYQEKNRQKIRYFGEIHLQFEYKGQKGAPWIWLHVDPETLDQEASKAGWLFEMIHQEPCGDYLVKLTEK